MLLCTRTHFIKSLPKLLAGEDGSGTPEERHAEGKAMTERMRMYATDETGLNPGSSVWFWKASIAAKEDETENEKGVFSSLMQGSTPKPGQRVVYVDGGFDLFSSGHIEFLRQVIKAEEKLAEGEGWYNKEAVEERLGKGADYAPCFVVAGVHDDEVINHWKGVNYPIMNIYERGLCVLQCKVFNVPQYLFQVAILTLYSMSTLSSLVRLLLLPRHILQQLHGEYLMPSIMGQQVSCH